MAPRAGNRGDDVDATATNIFELAWDDAARSKQGGFLRLSHDFTGDIVQSFGDHAELDGTRAFLPAECFCQSDQAKESSPQMIFERVCMPQTPR